ncbi:SPOR domain-containing protein [Paenibacillus humicola]|uniref:SPOR domain-containing protein n=1 Tax=Paenibacillus humicola TaxID=3110540 RepID=UPI00237B3DE8|nr:SPOR domain-containing protein [Paenibacillus humicola]
MNSKARITYRFDKQNGIRLEPQQKEQKAAKPALGKTIVPLFGEEMNFTSEIGPWNSPFQDDAFALEQLIRETDGQRADGGREPAESPDGADIGAGKKDGSQHRLDSAVGGGSRFVKGSERQTAAEETDGPDLYEYDFVPLGDEDAGMRRPDFDGEENIHTPIIELEEEGGLTPFVPGKHAAIRGAFFSAPAANYRTTRGPSWFKVFASVTAAVATGALFGYMVLALFAGGDGAQIPDQSAKETAASASAPDGSAAAGGKQGASAAAGTGAAGGSASKPGAGQNGGAAALKVNLPSESYYVLQYGVFSSQDGLDAAVGDLNAKGLAAAPLATGSDFRVYVGLAADKDGAAQLQNSLPGMDVYIKPVDIPSVGAVAFTGDAKNIESFFKLTGDLIRQMDGMTIGGLTGQTDKSAGDWQTLHQQWTTAAGKIQQGLTRAADKDGLAKLAQAVNSAAVAAGEYAKKPSDAALWTVQASLMKAVFAQKDWFASMDAL